MSQARPTETSKSTGFGLKTPQRSSEFSMPLTSVHKVETDGVRVFYRAAGDQNSPIVLLLHGFSASSFMFRELIPRLANEYRVITPDLPGFGFTEVPAQRKHIYSFDRLPATLNAFMQALKIRHFALYVFDHGAPTGFRLAMAHPDRVSAIERPGNKDIQLDLFLDYAANVELYPAFQDYFRKAKPPLLAIWGKNDRFFIPAGAEAFRKDILSARIEFLDTGHFAIETHAIEIAAAMKEFLAANGVSRRAEGASQ